MFNVRRSNRNLFRHSQALKPFNVTDASYQFGNVHFATQRQIEERYFRNGDVLYNSKRVRWLGYGW